MAEFITRFAPSPSGYLHLGHAYSAQLAFSAAREYGGHCLLRIEDIDQTRCRLEFEQAIYRDLDWLGFEWPEPVRRQSAHFADYSRVLETLHARGLVYRCFKTRKDVLADSLRAPHISTDGQAIDIGPVYQGPEKPMPSSEEEARLEAGQSYAWRLSISACRDILGSEFSQLEFTETGQGPAGEHGIIKACGGLLGDVVLARKDCPTSYHLACCHDDALQGVSHIYRGCDLFYITHLHCLLQYIMGWHSPIYHHHALLKDNKGQRFAKRDKATTLHAMRDAGLDPSQIRTRF